MIIDYLGHSGFFVQTEGAMLLFDYYRGELPFFENNCAEKQLFVFVSHAHSDHFNPQIFALAEKFAKTKFLLSFDIEGSGAVPSGVDAEYLFADANYKIEGLGTVQTLASTDEGVAFLVKTAHGTLFHAGDLNWWDWPGEESEWLAEQEKVFHREISKLKGINIDVAFIVLDDRLEQNFAKGMELFLSECSARYVLPMHFWKDRSVAQRLMALPCAAESDAVILNTAEQNRWQIDTQNKQEAKSMKYKMIHENYNVADLERSLAFYEKALGLTEKRRNTAKDGSFIIVYIGNENSEFELELTWLRDHPEPYDIGEEEFHLAFRTDDYAAAHALHEQMGCICFENPAMGIYFIQDPDGYWLEVIPTR